MVLFSYPATYEGDGRERKSYDLAMIKAQFEILRSLDTNQSNLRGTFEEAILPRCPWVYYQSAVETNQSQIESYRSTEKFETLKSLATYVEKSAEVNETGSAKVSFPGGEITQSLTREDDITLPIASPAVESQVYRVLCLGDLLAEKEEDKSKAEEVNSMISRMVSAMKLGASEWQRKPSLRYYIHDDGDGIQEEQKLRNEQVIHRLFQFIARHQIEVVLAFGAVEARSLLGRRVRLASIHGKFLSKTINFSDGKSHSFLVVPLFHPEYLRVNPQMRQTVWNDLQQVMVFLAKS